MAIRTVNTWVITAGVLLHGRTRAIPDAIQATPTATMASSTMNAIAFEVVQASARRRVDHVEHDHHAQADRLGGLGRGRHAQHAQPRARERVAAERIPIVSHPSWHR